MQINFKQLQAFVWVADLGSFRKAADRLNTTQPNISSRIASLEDALNVSLMTRDAGSVRLTSKGDLLLGYARTVLKAGDEFLEAANQEPLVDGVLRLGVTEMVVHTWLRPFLKALKDRFPKITVELTVDLSANLDKELFDRSIDLAFQSGPFNRSMSGSIDLGVYPMTWIASPQIGLHVAPLTLDRLAAFPVLTHARGTEPHREVAEHFSQHKERSVRLVPSSNLRACIQMSVDGYGSAAVPRAMVMRELANQELVELDYDWTPGSLAFSARFDADRADHYVARAAQLAVTISSTFLADTDK